MIINSTFDDLYNLFAGKKRCLKKEGGGPEKHVWPAGLRLNILQGYASNWARLGSSYSVLPLKAFLILCVGYVIDFLPPTISPCKEGG